MDIERKKDLSIYYWLVNLFSGTSYIEVKDGFPIENLTVPTVAVEYRTIALNPFELGNSVQEFRRMWYMEVFANNKSQRDDMGYKIIRALQSNIPVYNYDEGFPPEVTPTQLGCLIPRNIRMTPIRVMPQLTQKLYYRASVSFEAELNTLI